MLSHVSHLSEIKNLILTGIIYRRRFRDGCVASGGRNRSDAVENCCSNICDAISCCRYNICNARMFVFY